MDYIEALIIVPVGLIILAGVFVFASWEEWDDRRRSDRLVHRNLERMAGR